MFALRALYLFATADSRDANRQIERRNKKPSFRLGQLFNILAEMEEGGRRGGGRPKRVIKMSKDRMAGYYTADEEDEGLRNKRVKRKPNVVLGKSRSKSVSQSVNPLGGIEIEILSMLGGHNTIQKEKPSKQNNN